MSRSRFTLTDIEDLNTFIYKACCLGDVVTDKEALSEWDNHLNRIYGKLYNGDTLSTLSVEDVLLLALTFCYKGNRLALDYIHNNIETVPSELGILCERNLDGAGLAYFNRNQWVNSYGKSNYNLNQLITGTKTLRTNYEEIKKLTAGGK